MASSPGRLLSELRFCEVRVPLRLVSKGDDGEWRAMPESRGPVLPIHLVIQDEWSDSDSEEVGEWLGSLPFSGPRFEPPKAQSSDESLSQDVELVDLTSSPEPDFLSDDELQLPSTSSGYSPTPGPTPGPTSVPSTQDSDQDDDLEIIESFIVAKTAAPSVEETKADTLKAKEDLTKAAAPKEELASPFKPFCTEEPMDQDETLAEAPIHDFEAAPIPSPDLLDDVSVADAPSEENADEPSTSKALDFEAAVARASLKMTPRPAPPLIEAAPQKKRRSGAVVPSKSLAAPANDVDDAQLQTKLLALNEEPAPPVLKAQKRDLGKWLAAQPGVVGKDGMVDLFTGSSSSIAKTPKQLQLPPLPKPPPSPKKRKVAVERRRESHRSSSKSPFPSDVFESHSSESLTSSYTSSEGSRPSRPLRSIDMFAGLNSPMKAALRASRKLVKQAARGRPPPPSPDAGPSLFKSHGPRIAHRLTLENYKDHAVKRKAAVTSPTNLESTHDCGEAEGSGTVLSQIMEEMEPKRPSISPEIVAEIRPSTSTAPQEPAPRSLIFGVGRGKPTAQIPPRRKRHVGWRPDAELVQVRPISPRWESEYWRWAKEGDNDVCVLDTLLGDEASAPALLIPAAARAVPPCFEDDVRHTILRWNPDWLAQYHAERLKAPRVLPPPIHDPKEKVFRAPTPLPAPTIPVDNFISVYLPTFRHLALCEIWEEVYQRFQGLQTNPSLVKPHEFVFVLESQDMHPEMQILHLVTLIHQPKSDERRGIINAYENSLMIIKFHFPSANPAAPKLKSRSSFGFVREGSVKMENVGGEPELRGCLRGPWLGGRWEELRATVAAEGWKNVRELRVQLIVRRSAHDAVTPTTFSLSPHMTFTPTARFIRGPDALMRNPLGAHLLSPSLEFCGARREAHVPAAVPDFAVQSLNQSQAEAVAAIAADVIAAPNSPRVSLVQGPPGTGKSRTIVSLLFEILNRTKKEQREGLILVVAPSNGAVDQLSQSFIKANNNDGSKFSFLRFGQGDSVADDIRPYCLENLIETTYNQKKPDREKSALISELRGQESLQTTLAPLAAKEPTRFAAVATRIQSIRHRLSFLDTAQSSSLRERQTGKRESLLQKAHVVATTLNSSGHAHLANLCRWRPVHAVVVDEACQATELDALIPLRFHSAKLVLVGDPEQLPPTVLSQDAAAGGLADSLFGRLHRALPDAAYFLNTQYRMEPDIAAWPSERIYGSRLLNDASTRRSKLPVPYHVFSLAYARDHSRDGASRTNPDEARFVVQLCRLLQGAQAARPVLQEDSIGVISFYKAQVALINSELRKSGIRKVDVRTVDGFQGREKNIIILSCVRSSNTSIGFLDDRRRMNVALTRARDGLYVVGNLAALGQCGEDWASLQVDAVQRGVLSHVPDVRGNLNALAALQLGGHAPPPQAPSHHRRPNPQHHSHWRPRK